MSTHPWPEWDAAIREGRANSDDDRTRFAFWRQLLENELRELGARSLNPREEERMRILWGMGVHVTEAVRDWSNNVAQNYMHPPVCARLAYIPVET